MNHLPLSQPHISPPRHQPTNQTIKDWLVNNTYEHEFQITITHPPPNQYGNIHLRSTIRSRTRSLGPAVPRVWSVCLSRARICFFLDTYLGRYAVRLPCPVLKTRHHNCELDWSDVTCEKTNKEGVGRRKKDGGR